MNWQDDEYVWKSLDKLLRNCRNDVDEFLRCLYVYIDDLDINSQAILFGGIGKLVMSYNAELQICTMNESLSRAFIAVQSDRRVQQMMASAVEQAIDEKIENMKGE